MRNLDLICEGLRHHIHLRHHPNTSEVLLFNILLPGNQSKLKFKIDLYFFLKLSASIFNLHVFFPEILLCTVYPQTLAHYSYFAVLFSWGLVLHNCDVTMSAMVSQITSLMIVYSTVNQALIEENIKAPCHWPLWGEFTGDRWIPLTKGQWNGKCFHLMTSSCGWFYPYHFGLLHRGNYTFAPVPVKQTWGIWLNMSHESTVDLLYNHMNIKLAYRHVLLESLAWHTLVQYIMILHTALHWRR